MTASIHRAPDPSSTNKKPWRTLAAGLLLLGTAGSMMVYGAPAHASAHGNAGAHSSGTVIARLEASAQPGSAQAKATAQAKTTTNKEEGTLVSATLLQRVSEQSVRTELAGARFAPGAPALGGGDVRYGVDAYRVTYRTVDANGRPVVASGLVVFPAGGVAGSATVVSYDHGTTATSADTPSSFGLGPDHAVEGRWSAELFASAGFAVTEPDYVGMGTGTGPIEYLITKSEVTASADLITAARTLAGEHGYTLRHKVLVTGFSQGGQAAMALGRDLQQKGELGALAPVSGPYELLTAELPGLFNGQLDPAIQSYYAGYVLTTWNRLYGLYTSPAVAFRAPYANEMARLFDGSQQDGTVIAKLPPTLDKLLTPKFYAWLQHPTGALRTAMQANDTCSGWRPDVPVKLFAASGDTTVTQVNAEQCAQTIHVPVVRLGDVSHEVSDFVALPQIVRWFQQLS